MVAATWEFRVSNFALNSYEQRPNSHLRCNSALKGVLGPIFRDGVFSAASIATVPYVLKYLNGMPQTATLFDKVIFPVGVPISNNLNAIAHDPTCRGSVTLSSGAGVFSNQCIFPKDVSLSNGSP